MKPVFEAVMETECTLSKLGQDAEFGRLGQQRKDLRRIEAGASKVSAASRKTATRLRRTFDEMCDQASAFP
jgi:hypothetical protein